jgi:hypothetical protein
MPTRASFFSLTLPILPSGISFHFRFFLVLADLALKAISKRSAVKHKKIRNEKEGNNLLRHNNNYVFSLF